MIKDMLIKYGFFYLLDTASEEIFWELKDKNKQHFIVVENNLVTTKLSDKLARSLSGFLILGQTDEAKTHHLSTLFGVDAVMSFPFPSEKLAKKIIERSR